MAKVTLDWKAPSEVKMKEYVKTLGEEKMMDFADSCVVEKDGKISVNKSKAKKWLVANCEESGDIEWKNRPAESRPLSAAEEIASWRRKK